MLKKIILDFIGGTILVFIIMFTVFDGDLKPINYADSIFIVGLIMFSAGLLTVSNASKILRGISYSLKRMFTRRVDGMAYYEYIAMKDDKKERIIGLPLLLTGLTFIIVSLIIA